MGYEANTGLNVNNHYGERTTGNNAGVVGTMGREVEAVVDIDAETITNGGPLLVDFVIPAGAIISDAYAVVDEVFTLTGTTPTILVGTQGSEVTNGFVISEAQAEAAGTYDITGTLTGTWAAPLAADTTVGVALGGATPANTGGEGKVIIKYTITA